MKWTEPKHTGIDWETGRSKMPVPWKEITLEEFLLKAFCSPWQLTGEGMYRSVSDMPGSEGETVWFGGYSTTFLHHQHGYTLAVMKRHGKYNGKLPKGWAMLVGSDDWGDGYALRFFYVGCEHKNMKEVDHHFARDELGLSTWGMFCHVHWCPDCGYHFMVDSSG